MYKIACCDDDAAFLQHLEHMCLTIFHSFNIAIEVTLFTTFDVLYQSCMTSPEKFDLLILDVLIPNATTSNGIEFGKLLRKSGISASILYISSSTDYIIDGYDVQAIRYILKPVDPALLQRILLKDYENRMQKQRLILTKGSVITSVYYQDILYAETFQHQTIIHTEKECVNYAQKLDHLLAQLPSDTFIRCHQSFMINLAKVTLVRRYEAVITTHQSIPISKSYFKNVQNEFMRFLSRET